MFSCFRTDKPSLKSQDKSRRIESKRIRSTRQKLKLFDVLLIRQRGEDSNPQSFR